MSVIRFNSLYRADSITTSVGASALASVLSRVIGLARGVALAWLIPQAQFGLFGIALLVVNILLPVCSAGLYEGVTRYAPFHESAGTLRKFVIRSSLLAMGIALATTAILALFAEPVGSVLFSKAQLASGAAESPVSQGAAGTLARASMVCVWALAAYHTLVGLLRGLRMFRAVGVAELSVSCLFTLLAILGALGGFTTASALIVAYAIACVVAVLVFAPGVMVRLGSAKPLTVEESRRPESSLLTYSAWAAGTAVLWHALSYYPMWYLLKVSDSATVGTFHAVRIITQFVQIGAVMLTAAVAANVTRAWEHRGRSATLPRLTLLTKACLIVLIVGAMVLSLARPFVMRLFPSTFAAGRAAYDPLVLFFLLVGIVGLVAVRFNLLEKPRLACLAWLVGAVVNVIASYTLLTPAGDAGPVAQVIALKSAAWAGVAGVVAALIVCIGLVRRENLTLDAPTLLLVAASFSVGFGWPVALPVVLLLIITTFATDLIFSPREWREMRLMLIGSGGR
ncbi:MAG: hypothetical protein WBE26_11265 [Phycisphaerae bacterium]